MFSAQHLQELEDRRLSLERSINCKNKPRQWYLDLLTLPNKPFLREVPKKYVDSDMIAAYEKAGAYIEVDDIPESMLTPAKVLQFLAANPRLSLRKVPTNLRTPEVIDAFIAAGLDTPYTVPEHVLTRDRLLAIINNVQPGNINISKDMIDQEILDKLKEKKILHISQVPKHLLTTELCEELFMNNMASISDIPKSKMTKNIALLALERRFSDLEGIPVRLRDEDVCVAYCRKSPLNLNYVPPKIGSQVNARLASRT